MSVENRVSDQPEETLRPLSQNEARRVARETYKFRCCVVCGLQLAACLTVAHLDQNPGNNTADNLAFMCQTHHWMFDAKLYPVEAIRLLRQHWQSCEGVPDHSERIKDAGKTAAATRKWKRDGEKAARTRKLNKIAKLSMPNNNTSDEKESP